MMKCLRDLQESRVVLVCQHLFNRQRKNNKQNTLCKCIPEQINDGDFQTPFSPIFYSAEGGVCTQANIRMPFTTSAKLVLPGKY